MKSENTQSQNVIKRWIISIVEGALIGTGAVIPGVSGGVLAVIFGIYEPLMKFFANIRKDFKKNVFRFLPYIIGVGLGFVLLSGVVSWLLDQGETRTSQVVWFFIGAIVGTFPSLFKEAGKEGRKSKHLVIMVVTAILAFMFLMFVENLSADIEPNFFLWIVAGILVVSGAIVPGLSPSNFLMTMNMYKPMTQGIKDFDFGILIPLAIGGIFCLFAFSKLVNFLIERFHTIVFHVILGVVIASTAKIVPINLTQYDGGSASAIFICAGTFVIGLVLGLWMSKLEKKYKAD